MNLIQRQSSVFSHPVQQLDFDFLRDFEQSSLFDDDLCRHRLDSEYVWEGGDGDMYEDIVAST